MDKSLFASFSSEKEESSLRQELQEQGISLQYGRCDRSDTSTMKNNDDGFDVTVLRPDAVDDINFAGADIIARCNFRGMRIGGVLVEELFAPYRRVKAGDGEQG